MIKNPIWLQFIQYFIVLLLLPLLTLGLGIWGSKVVMTESLATATPIFFFAAISLYTTFVCIPVAKYVSDPVTFSEEGMTVGEDNKANHYSWDDVSSTNHHAMMGVIYLLDKNGKRIYAVHKSTHGYRAFDKVIREKVGVLS